MKQEEEVGKGGEGVARRRASFRRVEGRDTDGNDKNSEDCCLRHQGRPRLGQREPGDYYCYCPPREKRSIPDNLLIPYFS